MKSGRRWERRHQVSCEARSRSPLGTVLPRAAPAAGALTSTRAQLALLGRHHLLPDTLDPFTLQQLRGTGPPLWIPIEAPFQERNALSTQLLPAWQLRWVALRDVVHDGPLVVQTCPWATTGAHFQDDAAERPHVDGAEAAFVAAFDDFRGHVHRCTGHGLLLLRDFGQGGGVECFVVGGGGCFGWRLEGFVLAGYDFGGTKVDVLYYAIVIEEDVWRASRSELNSAVGFWGISLLSGLISRWAIPL